MTRPALIAVVGATGTGKSALALDVAERLLGQGTRCEIVNADAMQLYRGMDVGTAKLSVQERRGVPHHLLDVLDPRDEASVAWYQQRAGEVIDDVRARGAVPVLVGGSGLYVSSVLFRFTFPGTDPDVRSRLERELADSGPGLLHRRLAAVDPDAARAIGAANGRRLVRALEVVEITGRPFGSGLPDPATLLPGAVVLGLTAPREELVAVLDERVAGMWAGGVLDEARALLDRGMGVTASRAIGYAQALAQLRGEVAEGEAVAAAAALTRRYARRQVSWFRRYPAVTWLGWRDPERLATAMARLGV